MVTHDQTRPSRLPTRSSSWGCRADPAGGSPLDVYRPGGPRHNRLPRRPRHRCRPRARRSRRVRLGTHATDSAAEGAVEAALRPEQIVLHSADEPGIRTGAVGTVRHCDYFGHDALVHVALDDGSEIAARLGRRRRVPRTGERSPPRSRDRFSPTPVTPTAAHALRVGATPTLTSREGKTREDCRLPRVLLPRLAGHSTGGRWVGPSRWVRPVSGRGRATTGRAEAGRSHRRADRGVARRPAPRGARPRRAVARRAPPTGGRPD